MHVVRGFRWPRGRSKRSCMAAGTQMRGRVLGAGVGRDQRGRVPSAGVGRDQRGRVLDVGIGCDQPWLPRMKSNFVMTPSSSKVGFKIPMCGRKW